MLADNLAPQPMTDIFTQDTSIDRRQCGRKVPMKVLALGVGRTGTACMSSYIYIRTTYFVLPRPCMVQKENKV